MIPTALIAAALLVFTLGYAYGVIAERKRYREALRSLGEKGYLNVRGLKL